MTGVYDAWNRLVSIPGTASYSYDGLNRRTTTTVDSTTRHAYYTSSWQNIEERLDGSPAPDRQFVWGLRYLDDLVLRDRFTSGGSFSDRYYAAQDANWNVTAIVDATGAVKERYRYSAYGVPSFLNADFSPDESSDFNWTILFCGYDVDSESGLYQVRNRLLNPMLGVWNRIDPIASVDYSEATNLFWYVHDSPTNRVDSFGLQDKQWESMGQPLGDDLQRQLNELNRQINEDFNKRLCEGIEFEAVGGGIPDKMEWEMKFTKEIPFQLGKGLGEMLDKAQRGMEGAMKGLFGR